MNLNKISKEMTNVIFDNAYLLEVILAMTQEILEQLDDILNN